MKYVIWGAGERGARLFFHMMHEEVEAFIDNDKKKWGKKYCGKIIISFDEYKRRYSKHYIIISYIHEDEVVKILEKNHINEYFLMSECPGEFQEPYPKDILKNYIINYVKSNKTYAIYGCTLYSLILYKWLLQKENTKIYIIPHEKVSYKMIQQLEMEFLNVQFISLEDICQKGIDEILVTVEQDMTTVSKRKNQKTVVTNVYDCSDRIQEYYNPKIKKLKNIHIGERCFIVATGPSLRMEDLNKLDQHQEICISMNHIWRAFPNTKWRPQYYIAMDYHVLRDSGKIMENEDIPYMFWGDTDREYWMEEHNEKHLKHHLVYECKEKGTLKFSDDFSRKSYQGATVTYTALQLAVYMGVKQIYLIGVDFSYAGKNGTKYAHFYKEDKFVSIGYTKQVTLAYESAKRYADLHDIKIYNATRGGNLEIFPRVEFDELFH